MLLPSVFEDRVFDDFMKMPEGFNKRPLMKTDIKELSDSYSLRIDLPGVKKDGIGLTLKDGYLVVKAETDTSSEKKDEDGRYVRRERYQGSASRSFYVGHGLKPENVNAKFEDGVLEITVPKGIEEKKEDCTIKIEG